MCVQHGSEVSIPTLYRVHGCPPVDNGCPSFFILPFCEVRNLLGSDPDPDPDSDSDPYFRPPNLLVELKTTERLTGSIGPSVGQTNSDTRERCRFPER